MNRPFVFINVAMTADGKIDTFQRKGAAISSARDKDRADKLRAEADAVMVGRRTLLDEDPKLTVKSNLLRANVDDDFTILGTQEMRSLVRAGN